MTTLQNKAEGRILAAVRAACKQFGIAGAEKVCWDALEVVRVARRKQKKKKNAKKKKAEK